MISRSALPWDEAGRNIDGEARPGSGGIEHGSRSKGRPTSPPRNSGLGEMRCCGPNDPSGRRSFLRLSASSGIRSMPSTRTVGCCSSASTGRGRCCSCGWEHSTPIFRVHISASRRAAGVTFLARLCSCPAHPLASARSFTIDLRPVSRVRGAVGLPRGLGGRPTAVADRGKARPRDLLPGGARIGVDRLRTRGHRALRERPIWVSRPSLHPLPATGRPWQSERRRAG